MNRKQRSAITGIFLLLAAGSAMAQQRIDLWPAGATPASLGTDTIKDIPCIYVYQPAAALRNGSAMVICPGGGYVQLAMAKEGSDVAAWFSAKGITCFVLRYRLCINGYTRYPIRNDGLRAMRLVRARAKEWNIDTARLGVMGFSAGGHMASMMSTQFDDGNSSATDTIDRVSSRPAFSVLCYPVITCTLPYAWGGTTGGLRSTGNFLGPNPLTALVDSFSSEKRVTPRTPKAFLVHDYADGTVPYQNSIMYRDSCLRKMVPAVFLRVYSCNPGHGFGLACGNWADSVSVWMAKQGIYTPATGTIENNPSDQKKGLIDEINLNRMDRAVYYYDLGGRRLQMNTPSMQLRGHVVLYRVVDKSGKRIFCGKKAMSDR